LEKQRRSFERDLSCADQVAISLVADVGSSSFVSPSVVVALVDVDVIDVMDGRKGCEVASSSFKASFAFDFLRVGSSASFRAPERDRPSHHCPLHDWRLPLSYVIVLDEDSTGELISIDWLKGATMYRHLIDQFYS